jgi:hypothetical protein
MRDLGSIMAEVEKATEGMTDKQRDAALSAIFQEESIRGVNIMLATGSERYQELEAKLRSSEGAAKSMADTMEGGVGGAIREMESALEELMIVLGNIVVVGVTPLIKYITDLADWFSKLPAPIQQTVVAIGAILAVIGPLLVDNRLGCLCDRFSSCIIRLRWCSRYSNDVYFWNSDPRACDRFRSYPFTYRSYCCRSRSPGSCMEKQLVRNKRYC